MPAAVKLSICAIASEVVPFAKSGGLADVASALSRHLTAAGHDVRLFTVGESTNYYAVDHSPSYLWNSATWEISEALLPHLRTVMDGPGSWDRDETIRRAIEIRDGVIRNPKILSFQRRSAEFPHTPM